MCRYQCAFSEGIHLSIRHKFHLFRLIYWCPNAVNASRTLVHFSEGPGPSSHMDWNRPLCILQGLWFNAIILFLTILPFVSSPCNTDSPLSVGCSIFRLLEIASKLRVLHLLSESANYPVPLYVFLSTLVAVLQFKWSDMFSKASHNCSFTLTLSIFFHYTTISPSSTRFSPCPAKYFSTLQIKFSTISTFQGQSISNQSLFSREYPHMSYKLFWR